jgi:mRNA interferase MazF
MNEIRRGEIFYIARGGGASCGSEQYADRPAVVVSNDENNKHSGIIEVAYLTTQPKTELPTHVTIRSTGRVSTVLCEQVTSVSVERVNNYIGQVSEQEMKNIDIALMISLQLDGDSKSHKQYNETIKKQQEEIEYYRNKIQAMQQSLEEKKSEKPQEAAGETSEIVVRLETERDTYKALYEQLFERLLTMGGTGN